MNVAFDSRKKTPALARRTLLSSPEKRHPTHGLSTRPAAELWFAMACGYYLCHQEAIEGLDRDAVQSLRQLPLQDVGRLFTADVVDIHLKPTLLARRLQALEETRASERLIDELTRGDAPREMLRHYFGITNADYRDLRVKWGLSRTGRSPAPDMQTEARVTAVWRRLFGERRYDAIKPQDYLRLQGLVEGLPLRLIWSIAKRWLK